MNIENNQEDMQQDDSMLSATEKNIGERLRQAREQLGLTQQAVAERLCLKTSTIAIIENGLANEDIAPTFLRGYIRAYAKLVKLPEDELSQLLKQQVPEVIASNIPKQNFTIRKRRRRKEGWLSSFTWLILFAVIGLTVAWWWQNHKSQKIANMLPVDNTQARLPAATNKATPHQASLTTPASSMAASTAARTTTASSAASQANPLPGLLTPASSASAAAGVVSSQATSVSSAAIKAPQQAGQLTLRFVDHCWLEIIDADSKVLVRGSKNKGDSLQLMGKAPFKMIIGAPNAVDIKYQGKKVDMSSYVKKPGQVVRFTLQ